MGIFKVKSKVKLSELAVDTVINESDFATMTPDGHFVQLEYVEDEATRQPYIVKPGIWAIQKTMQGLQLHTTSFNSDKLLETFTNTKNITDKIDCFFNKIPVYKELGYDVAKRAALLFGPPGTGKSSSITVIANKYTADNKTAVILWHTDKFEPYQVKDFIKSFSYEGVDKIILIAEDIGGTEIENQRMRSDSSLLSLLDNQEKTFTIPTFILATTNYAENFLGNLTNRYGRFDDKIEVDYPSGEQRVNLFKFFAKKEPSEAALKLMGSDKTKEFSPAHIKEVIIRSMIYDKLEVDVINDILKEVEHFKAMFTNKKQRMGFGMDDD